jgi:hypothetical protein
MSQLNIVMLCHVMSCYVMLCYVVLCCIVLSGQHGKDISLLMHAHHQMAETQLGNLEGVLVRMAKEVSLLEVCFTSLPTSFLYLTSHFTSRLTSHFNSRLTSHFTSDFTSHFTSRLTSHFTSHFTSRLTSHFFCGRCPAPRRRQRSRLSAMRTMAMRKPWLC